jgi:hypothetical protein
LTHQSTAPISVFASHGLVLIYLSHNPEPTVREMALQLSMTERHVARILRDLANAELITVGKRGNRNVYTLNEEASGLHPSVPSLRLGKLMAVMRGEGEAVTRAYRDVTAKLAAFLIAPFSVGEAESIALLVRMT